MTRQGGIIYRHARVLLVGVALGTPASAAIPGQLGDAWAFIQQGQQWIESLGNLDALKEQILGEQGMHGVQQQLMGKLVDKGLSVAGIDVQGLLGQAQQWQDQIDQLKGALTNQARGVVNLAFLDPAEQGSSMAGSLALNPNLAQNRYEAAEVIARNTVKEAENVQLLADAAEIVEEAKQTVDETRERAQLSAENAVTLATEARGIQSTREGVELLIRAQAESIISSAYNATAITTALSQQVREQHVMNQQLGELVSHELNEKTSRARQAIEEIRARQAQAKALGSQIERTISTAASGINSAFQVRADDINPNDLF